MSAGAAGSDKKISGAKIQPLESEQKRGVAHDPSPSRGAAGSGRDIDGARIDPLGGGGQYRRPAPHADTGGAVGRDEDVGAARIEPLGGGGPEASRRKNPGLDDEIVDKARTQPLGSVRGQVL
ncbi:hypothetical protein DL766_007380 [Monosporascus sp. MC13-8B]|uniref:SMP domain-containing protein n=1 Tax=Monosporascus cannonballus TaxID=155416 RepID=A0ABY0H457_9PEZI|nr:hypothetical protein DL762_007215 [Monosporascus cannonballus]RYO88650.1 hypothetical protein DL763_005924 [Monosporascus cannonballus]RYP24081.1 hypothetical protein DL766_007380 [Monosporascus sp. MC13-8B]